MIFSRSGLSFGLCYFYIFRIAEFSLTALMLRQCLLWGRYSSFRLAFISAAHYFRRSGKRNFSEKHNSL